MGGEVDTDPQGPKNLFDGIGRFTFQGSGCRSMVLQNAAYPDDAVFCPGTQIVHAQGSGYGTDKERIPVLAEVKAQDIVLFAP